MNDKMNEFISSKNMNYKFERERVTFLSTVREREPINFFNERFEH